MDFFLSFPFFLLLIGVSFVIQWNVSHVIAKYHKKHNSRDITGAELAHKMLEQNGIYDVKIQEGQGRFVADFYDPSKKLVNLSPQVYKNTSISALAVAAHEVGHAIQHHEQYSPLMLRSTMYPLAQLGSWLGPILLLIGIFFKMGQLFTFGIYFYAAAVAFTVLNLPVEFDASARAEKWLATSGFVMGDEKKIVHKILQAAAMTYVMAALIAVIELLRMIAWSRGE